MPLIRKQNLILRGFLSIIPSYAANWYMVGMGEEFYWGGFFHIYKTIVIDANLHDQIYA